ncbi:MAG: TAXI family TRAP transporter solute-binding subunit [Gemmatimonadota bacterium]|nr:TAXI family TRAP transporter solute-binding subunit [Gemmatimonadota bacterium]MDH3422941.1 TAXI family TRAP transporter solute-binding subunit [Gemmatimonadota bacterium]
MKKLPSIEVPRAAGRVRRALFTALLCTAGLAGCTAGERPDFLALATAGTGGVYYLIGGSIAEIWSRELADHIVVAEVTGGSVENLSLLMSDQVAVAFSMGTNALGAYAGSNSFEGGEPGRVLALVALYPNVLQLASLQGGGVQSLQDLVGRRVSVGAPGSGTEVGARTLLEANGIGYEDFEPQRLNFNETANGIRDGTVDAGFWSAGPPTSSIMDLATGREIHLIPLSDEEVARTAAVDPTVRRDVIPAGAYRGQNEPVPTLSTPNLLVVRSDMSEDLAYSLIRVLLEAQPELAQVHPVAGRISAEYTLDVSPIPLHPGVVRYLREEGFEVPDRLIPAP